jgi:hypothetical protein
VVARTVGQRAGDEAQEQRHGFRRAHHHADRQGRRTQGAEERPEDRLRPVGHHVGRQADEPEADHHAPRREGRARA